MLMTRDLYIDSSDFLCISRTPNVLSVTSELWCTVGPSGIWTLQSQNKDMPACLLPLDQARPTFTHMALVALHKAGLVRCVLD